MMGNVKELMERTGNATSQVEMQAKLHRPHLYSRCF